MDAVKLYNRYPLEELTSMATAIREDPANKNTQGGIYLYTKAARKKLDAIAWAITYHLQDRKEQKNGTNREDQESL